MRVTWTGGVRLPNGDDPGELERSLYRLTLENPDGLKKEVEPEYIADLGDNDNNHFLCLNSAAPAISVSFPAGRLVDPNGDLNLDSRVPIF